MASRVSASTATSDEIFVHDPGVSLCLMVNRRARTLRVIDFRTGPSPVKRAAVMNAARREGIERVYTLVERDESATWTKMGFEREGNIPGFYKRSDAYVLGAWVPGVVEEEDAATERSGLHAVQEEQDLASERCYAAARAVAKARESEPELVARVHAPRDADLQHAIHAAVRTGRALTGFEPFGRDVTRSFHACTSRGGLALVASVETQTCFNNALIELLTAPRTEKEAALARSAVRQLCDQLLEREVVGCFAVSPVTDAELAAVYLVNAFRRTGVLRGHLLLGKSRVDAFLWSRKLAQPSDT